ncbi:hypothetical protein Golob_020127, partial [Gossypium lobatum]|nr:hypothetical protein [Gossypium lobatum]
MSISKLRAAIGGVIRDPTRCWMVGFEMVKIESDNALLIDTLRNGLVAVSNIVEVRMIREWFYKSWE